MKPSKASSKQKDEHPVDLPPSPVIEHFNHFLRQNEIAILLALFILVEVAVLAMSFRDFRQAQRKSRQDIQRVNALSLRIHYEKELERNPFDTNARYRLAQSAYLAGEYDKAIDALKRLEDRGVKKLIALPVLMAKAYYKKGDMENAERYFHKTLLNNAKAEARHKRRRSTIYDSEFEFLLAQFLLQKNKPVEAAAWFESVLDDPEYSKQAKAQLRELEIQTLGGLARATTDTLRPKGLPPGEPLTAQALLNLVEPSTQDAATPPTQAKPNP